MSSEEKALHPARVAGLYPLPLIVLGLLTGVAIAVLWLVDPRQVALSSCSLHEVTGLYCPGCGATRATHQLLHGELISALRYNALWVLSLPVALYCISSELRRLARGRPLPGDPVRNRWFLVGAFAVAVLFGLLRNLPMYPFVLLVPPAFITP